MALTIGYSCKYAPVELIRAYGAEAVLLGSQLAGSECDVSAAGRPLHPNLCSFAKRLQVDASTCDGAVLVDCCDSVRRVGDCLAAEASTAAMVMELPHCLDGCGRRRFTQALIRLAAWLEDLTGHTFDRREFLEAWRDAAEGANPGRKGTHHAISTTATPHVALIGARVSPNVRQVIEHDLRLPLRDYTCQGARYPAAYTPTAPEAEFSDLMGAYADALLNQVPCLRMADIAGRRTLVDDPALAGVIYSTVKFCDYYPFEFATLAAQLEVPIVRIETEYEAQASEQVRTRVGALNELLGETAEAPDKPVEAKQAPQSDKLSQWNSKAPGLYVGIDSGSTSTNVVVVDETGAIRAEAVLRTGAKATRSAQAALDQVSAELGVDTSAYRAIVGTGYGRNHLDFATRTVTEITCHAKGAHHLNPQVRTIIDIGGQDSKVIALDEQGRVATFAMNDKCAAGTGRFFEAMARTLEIDLDTMAAMTPGRGAVTLSSLCTVFAESEVIGLIAEDCETEAIVGGLNRAVATRTEALLRRTSAAGPYLMTGGVAHNRGLVAELSRRLGEPVAVASEPEMVGALGAALIAAFE